MRTVRARGSDIGEVARAKAAGDSSTQQVGFSRISIDLHGKRK